MNLPVDPCLISCLIVYAAAIGLCASVQVYMGVRSETRGHAALDRMQKEGGWAPGSVEVLKIDLSTPRAARAGADAFMAQADGRLDILSECI